MPRKPAKYPLFESKSRHTYADYLTWPEGERWELIDGVAYPLMFEKEYGMSPAPNRAHQEIVGEFHLQLGNALRGHPCKVYLAPFDVRLSERLAAPDAEIENVVQPDIAVFCNASSLDFKGAIGAPDFVIEVLSPSTAAKDRKQKADLYARFGVREYWTVDPETRAVAVRLLDAGARTYPAVATMHALREGTVALTALPGVGLDLTQFELS